MSLTPEELQLLGSLHARLVEQLGRCTDDERHALESSREIAVLWPKIAVELKKLAARVEAGEALYQAIRNNHYGRMPDEVQAAYDKFAILRP